MKLFNTDSNSKRLFSLLFENIKKTGLPDLDIANAKDFYNNREFELALDTIVTQLYEYNLKIDDNTYNIIISIIKELKLNSSTYSFLNELLNNE